MRESSSREAKRGMEILVVVSGCVVVVGREEVVVRRSVVRVMILE